MTSSGSLLARRGDVMRLLSARRAGCLILGLASCLACVTPVPVERLEEGMSADAVREAFGEPEAMGVEPEGDVSTWIYVDEELDVVLAILASPLWVTTPLALAMSLLPGQEHQWDDFYAGLRGVSPDSKNVLLFFEADHLARWDVVEREQEYAYSGPTHDWLQQWRWQQQVQQWERQQRRQWGR
jgi:outer membrane protein assembly factor BamE (lipoprotein component of BamABCDE complex)